ncbi:DEDD exonuclease domain-containing protein [Demequina sp. B12]|uniref:DEDD exonuclease domain-containing protein n=1 Tax=Demequina sp. B12 TaxID=2992757 RepID=UPI00237AA2D5|nr:DEDD exonuclease domain-containing protein [Demequina sp. B12]MDE0572963.1 DEDD exonuclease domain-containing protein [Demequina sp. B12]
MEENTVATLDDFGEPLSATTFVVLDLETTGASPQSCGITEIGAVKLRGGEVIGEFHTLIDPGTAIPPMIVALTGITDAMVMAAPRIQEVLPALLEFIGDAVFVAHNARFDVGFLRAACHQHGYSWPKVEVLDTLTLARRVVTKEEAPNRKLGTLARVFGTEVTPNHRALDDARATGEILHGMLERLAAFGVTHRGDLDTLKSRVSPTTRAKATLADTVPAKPGVYVFKGPQGERLYVGTSKNLRARVKQYFTSSETRGRIKEMVELAVDVDVTVCATALEAIVLETRLIDQWRPRYNRRSARPERTPWVKLTSEPYPRLVVSRTASVNDAHLGPMRSGADAKLAIEGLQQALQIRTCATRLTITPRAGARACMLKDLGACSAPCVAGATGEYASAVARATTALGSDIGPVVTALARAVDHHAAREEYERAADTRDRLSAIVEAAERTARLTSLRACSIVAVHETASGWELASMSQGALVGAATVTSGVWKCADRLRDKWTTTAVDDTLVEESELLLRWLDRPGTRLLYVDGEWASPINGPGRYHRWVDARRADRESRAHHLQLRS